MLRSQPSSETSCGAIWVRLTGSYQPSLPYPLGAEGSLLFLNSPTQSLRLVCFLCLECLSPQTCTVHSLISFLRKVFLEPRMACDPDTLQPLTQLCFSS